MAQRNPAQLTDDQLFQDWLRWIQRAYDEAVGQARRFRLFRLVHGVYQQNDHLQHTGGFLFQWMADNYVAASAMAFRRELDTQAGTENLIHLLREMRDHPSVISRARFRATWSETEPNNGVYPGFPTPFWGLSGFFVGDLIGKASVGARGKRTAFSKARWARSVRPRRRQLPQGPSVRDKMAPREGAMRDVELDPPRPRTAVDRRTTMFASTPSTCTRRTLDLPRKDWDIRYLRYLGNSDIAK